MTRNDLQRLALMRVADAEVLLDAGRWPAGYYLLGYAVECALKACATHRFREHTVPERTLVNDFYTHRLDKILRISGVEDALEARKNADPIFQRNWRIVGAWDEASRYDHSVLESEARDMLEAVTNPMGGILTWVRALW